MNVISLRVQQSYAQRGLAYISKVWGNPKFYENCIMSSLPSLSVLPQWYILCNDDNEIIGCAGLCGFDFVSRADLSPYFCALHIDEEYRGHHYPQRLLNKAIEDAKRFGFENLYVVSDLVNYYEQFGFIQNETGVGLDEKEERIFTLNLLEKEEI